MKKIKARKSSFIKFLLSFFAVLTIGGAAVGFGTNFGYADPVGSWTVTDLAASSDNNGQWTSSGNNIEGKVTGTAETSDGCSTTPAASKNSTLTLTNNANRTKTISFDYSLDLNGGSAEIDGRSITESGSFEKDLSAGDSIKVYIASAKDAKTTTINLTAIRLAGTVATLSTIFEPSEGGTFSVSYNGGQAITISESKTLTNPNDNPYTLIATPNSGYKHVGWFVDGIFKLPSALGDNKYFYAETNNQVVSPRFVDSTAASFKVQSIVYYDFQEAIDAVNKLSSNKNIVVVGSGSINAGNYTISSGVALILPYENSSNGEKVRDLPEHQAGEYDGDLKPYVTLTLEDGVLLTINGTLQIGGRQLAGGGSSVRCGATSGPHGLLKMKAGSVINVGNGGKLYCWGFVCGFKNSSNVWESGTINALSGSTVREPMQFYFRGGAVTKALNSNKQKVLHFNQYYVQNIEVRIRFYYGSSEQICTAITGTGFSNTQTPAVPFIDKYTGGSNDKGMFRLYESQDGYCEKFYHPATDRLSVTICGIKIAIASISISLSVVTVNTANYILPLHSGFDIVLEKLGDVGAELTTNQSISVFPGAYIRIDEGCTLSVENNNSIVLHDKRDCSAWFPDGTINNKGNGNNYIQVNYTASMGKSHVRKNHDGTTFNKKDPPSSELDINGTLDIKRGHLYNTVSGANIHTSKGTGRVRIASTSNTTVYDYEYQEGWGSGLSGQWAYTQLQVYNPILQNPGNEEQPTTKVSDTITTSTVYVFDQDQNKWIDEKDLPEQFDVTFKDGSNTSSPSFTVKYTEGKDFTMPTQDTTVENGFNSTDKLLKWRAVSGVSVYVFDPGSQIDVPLVKDMVFEAYYGNEWITLGDGEYQYLYKVSIDSETIYPNGLCDVIHPIDGTVKTLKFKEEGIWDKYYDSAVTDGLFFYDSTVYPSGDDRLHYIRGGVKISDPGVVPIMATISGNYCLIGESGYVVTNIRTYIGDNEYIPSGWYSIGADGIIHTDSPVSIAADIAIYSDGNSAYGHGLFVYNNNYYYAKEDAHIVKASANDFVTFYVERTNSLTYNGELIEPGLYCFDSTGRMCSAPISGNDYIMRAS